MQGTAASTDVVERLERTVAKETIESAIEAFGLRQVELAAALGVDRRTLLRYRKLTSIPSPRVRVRMEKIRELQHLLSEVFSSREAGLKWLCLPVSLLRGRRPIDLMRRGELDEVLSVLAGLYSGAHV